MLLWLWLLTVAITANIFTLRLDYAEMKKVELRDIK